MVEPRQDMGSQEPEDPVTEEQDADSNSTLHQDLDALMDRARTMLSELDMYHQRWRSLNRDSNELGYFRGNVKSELSMLQRLHEKPDNPQTRQIMRSSNLPFTETVWSTAKRSKNVLALQKRIYAGHGVRAASQGMRRIVCAQPPRVRRKNDKENAVVVDAIADNGRTWLKVSMITNSRLLYDLAKQGWDSGGSDFDDEDSDTKTEANDDDRDVPLLKTAKDLTKAASTFRVRTKAPEVHMILPRVKPGEVAEIDAILDACRATGAKLFFDGDLSPPPPIEEAIRNMAVDPFESFSDVLNIDCTILLALVSEFSHARVSKEPWFHRALKRQVEIEDNENLLPNLMYPAMGSHKLVCTKQAAKRMREIVNIIGTPSERARTAILMGDDKSKSQAELVAEMQEWSAYQVPEHWQLPIHIVDEEPIDGEVSIAPEAVQVCKSMTDINKSVFLYGWKTGRTTLTSNRTVVKQLENDLEQFDNLDDSIWPPIWLCPTARSLVGKEKRSDKKTGARKEAEAWPLPDPLRREHQRRNGLDVLTLRQGQPVDDRRPDGYEYSDVIEAKEKAREQYAKTGRTTETAREAVGDGEASLRD